MSRRCAEAAASLYEIFVQGRCLVTDVRTAEMAKLAENSFRDINIAYANELSIVCDKLGIDVWDLIALANLHPRVNILNPGPGVGGHCIAVDPWFIVSQAPAEARLIRTAREVNDGKPGWVIEKITETVGAFLQARPGRTAKSVAIALLGLAFKADIDDLRESPALAVAREYSARHPGDVLVVEPNIASLPAGFSANTRLVTLDQALRNADICVVLVAHAEFVERAGHIGELAATLDTVGILKGSDRAP